jgi:hypothetical protein
MISWTVAMKRFPPALAAYALAVATCLPASWLIAHAAIRHAEESQPFQREDTVHLGRELRGYWAARPELVVRPDDSARVVSTRPHADPPFAEIEMLTGEAAGQTLYVEFRDLRPAK